MDPLNPSPIASGSQMPPMQQEPQKSSVGPVAGAVIVILLLVAGGLYFWGAQLNKEQANDVPFIPSNETSQDTNANLTSDTGAGLPPQSSSDDVSSIEADANAMDMSQLESQNNAELNNI
jgi:hypothetical protein